MSTISVRSEAAGFALGNKRARPASGGEKEPQFDADSPEALKLRNSKAAIVLEIGFPSALRRGTRFFRSCMPKHNLQVINLQSSTAREPIARTNHISCSNDPIPHRHQAPEVGARPPQYYSRTDQGRMLHSNLDDNVSSTLASHCMCRPRRVRSCGTGPPVRDLPKHNSSVLLVP